MVEISSIEFGDTLPNILREPVYSSTESSTTISPYDIPRSEVQPMESAQGIAIVACLCVLAAGVTALAITSKK